MESSFSPALLFHTVRYLKPVQIYGRIWSRFYWPAISTNSLPGLRKKERRFTKPIVNRPSQVAPSRFRLLNVERTIAKPADWNRKDWELLWRYHLHYFDDLNAVDARAKYPWHIETLSKWIRENPPGRGTAWNSYPLSLRIVNLVKWIVQCDRPPKMVLESLALQARFLNKRIEYHLMGNHLFANAKALVFAGLLFEGWEAGRWLAKGMELVEKEVTEQILSDGGHFELSPMYHSIILEDILDIINISQAFSYALHHAHHKLVARLPGIVGRMGNWLSTMVHPDGEIAFFNDASINHAAPLSAIEDYAGRLGMQEFKRPEDGLTALPASGYIRWQNNGSVALLDVARVGPDYIPGHAHADTLSFELSVDNRRFVVNSGTSGYGESAERLHQRGTAAHNTVTINGQNSSEVWRSFRVARRAQPIGLFISRASCSAQIECCHDGYRRLKGKPLHLRRWSVWENGLRVSDSIEGRFAEAVARYFFHPALAISASSGNTLKVRLSGGRIVNAQVLCGKMRLKESTFHPEFGKSVSNKCLEIGFEGRHAEIQFVWE